MKLNKKELLVRFSGYISVAIIVVVFVFVGMVTISKTGRSVRDIIIESALGFIAGMLIDSLLGMQGINDGKRNDEYLATKALHCEIVESIASYIHRLEAWCRRNNADNMRRQRTRILMNEEMLYEDYFDENGKAKGYTPVYEGRDKYELKRERARRKAYRQALRLKLTPLSTAALTAEGTNPDDPYDFGETEGEYKRHTLTSDAVKKALTAIIFGYYCVDQVLNFNYATLLWRGLQITIHLVSGVSKMLAARSFIVHSQRMQIVQKINHLTAFKNDVMEGKTNGER